MANRLPQRQRGRGSEQRVKMVATPCPMGPHFMDKYPIQRGQRVKFPKNRIGGIRCQKSVLNTIKDSFFHSRPF